MSQSQTALLTSSQEKGLVKLADSSRDISVPCILLSLSCSLSNGGYEIIKKKSGCMGERVVVWEILVHNG